MVYCAVWIQEMFVGFFKALIPRYRVAVVEEKDMFHFPGTVQLLLLQHVTGARGSIWKLVSRASWDPLSKPDKLELPRGLSKIWTVVQTNWFVMISDCDLQVLSYLSLWLGRVHALIYQQVSKCNKKLQLSFTISLNLMSFYHLRWTEKIYPAVLYVLHKIFKIFPTDIEEKESWVISQPAKGSLMVKKAKLSNGMNPPHLPLESR